MNVVVNGKLIECEPGASLHSVIVQLGLKSEAVVAERNCELVPGEDFVRTQLQEGDTLELLHFVGGG